MKKIKKRFQNLPSWIKNKYLVSFFLFSIWILFFDTHSVVNQFKKRSQIKIIENDIRFFNEEIMKDQKIINLLSSDTLSDELEKYFREKLFLSKKNEEIFMIE